MSPIETPAYRLTTDCIWNSFRNSRKRHLILTGAKKSGKSTLLCRLFPSPLPGVTTWAEPGKGVCLRDNSTGKTARIGVHDGSLPGTSNRMRVCPEGFLGLGNAALQQCAEADGEWVSIDEIGYLETGCPEYCQRIRALMDKKRLAAVVRKQSLPFLEELCRRVDVFLMDLDAPFGNPGCVIMASGQSRRFGGNKLMADFRGKPLIQWALDATEGIFAGRVVVTRHPAIEELCRRQGIPVIIHELPYRSDTVRLGLQAIMEEIDSCMFCPGDQPLLLRDTVASLALNALHEDKAIWRTAYEDGASSPVSAGSSAIVDSSVSTGSYAIVGSSASMDSPVTVGPPASTGSPVADSSLVSVNFSITVNSSSITVGSPVLFPKWAFPELLTLPEGKGGSFLLKKYPGQVRLVPVRDKYELMDVDTPEDLKLLTEQFPMDRPCRDSR